MPLHNFNLEENLYDTVKASPSKDFPPVEGGHLWDFREINDSLLRKIKSQGTKTPFPIPSCEKEFQRFLQVTELRTIFHEEVVSTLHIEPPKECLNRWLFNQLAVPRSTTEITVFSDHQDNQTCSDDQEKNTEQQTTTEEPRNEEPLLRCPSIAKDSKVLHTQLLENLPCSIYIPWGKKNDPQAMRSAYLNYIDKAIEWVHVWSKESSDAEADKVIIDLDNLKAEINRCDNAHELRKFKPVAVAACHSEFFAGRYSKMIDPIVNRVIERAQELSAQIAALETNPNEEQVSLSVQDKNIHCFEYKRNKVTISGLHYLKLTELYRLHNHKTDEEMEEQQEELHRALYVLARRYATFFGEGEGAAFHAAAPESAFEVMRNSLEVVQELFASPFNCHFAFFCSAFPDIDCWFGSCGSFFDFIPESGSYEVGPPYTIEVMDQTAAKLESVLKESTGPLSFIVFVPEWKEPVATYHTIMESSKFLRMDLVMGGNDHAYVVGDQHTSETRYFSLPFKTCVYVLQNDLGAEKWPVSDTLKQDLEISLQKPIAMEKEKMPRRSSGNRRDSSGRRHGDRRYNDRRYNDRNDRGGWNREDNRDGYHDTRNDRRRDNQEPHRNYRGNERHGEEPYSRNYRQHKRSYPREHSPDYKRKRY